MNLGRRQILRGTVATFGSAIPSWAQIGKSTKLGRMACNSWPFRAYFDTPEMHEYRDTKYPLLTQAEFPEFLADHFGIHNVEFLPQHFVDTNPATIEKLKAGLKKAKSSCCNLIGVELPGGAYAVNADVKAIAATAEKWVEAAVVLGSPCITVALGGDAPVDIHTAARNLKPFVDIAIKKHIKVLLHNDDIERESAEILMAVIEQLGPARVGTCPDFGNFATRSAAYALNQLRKLAPFASTICHAKDGIASNGKFYPDDFAGSMKVMREARFNGYTHSSMKG
jgi:sugar phosphate isomerase/epimerase